MGGVRPSKACHCEPVRRLAWQSVDWLGNPRIGVAIRTPAHHKGTCSASPTAWRSVPQNAYLFKAHPNGWCFSRSPLDASMSCCSPFSGTICHRHIAPNLDAPTSARDRRLFFAFLRLSIKKHHPNGRCFGRGRKARTLDTRFWRPLLYQLSYTPIKRLAP